MIFRFFYLILALALTNPAPADDETRTERIQFKRGSTSSVISGKITGRESVVYKLNARDGQFLQVRLVADKGSTNFNIYIPGRGLGDEALFTSETNPKPEYLGQLYKTGDHSIAVFLSRNAARRGLTASYKLHVSVTDEKPPAEEVPAKGPVPQKVIDDCLAALRKKLGQKTAMKVIKAERGENAFIVEIQAESAEKPWRCYHDSKKCTATEYLGEG